MSFDFKKDPFENFLKSFQEVQLKGVPEHNAMALSTIHKENNSFKPTCRIVLFKGLVESGFSFYTNYKSHKGQDLEQNQNVAATFFWPHIDHQIRIEGFVEKLTDPQSDQYFASRPRLSQIGAWASTQSEELSSFSEFQKKTQDIENKYAGKKIPRPPHWGGFKIIPLEIEFWFGKMGRLHERYIYQRQDQKTEWKKFLRFP